MSRFFKKFNSTTRTPSQPALISRRTILIALFLAGVIWSGMGMSKVSAEISDQTALNNEIKACGEHSGVNSQAYKKCVSDATTKYTTVTPADQKMVEDGCSQHNGINGNGYKQCVQDGIDAIKAGTYTKVVDGKNWYDWIVNGFKTLAEGPLRVAIGIIAGIQQLIIVPVLGALVKIIASCLDLAVQFTLDSNNITNVNDSIVTTWAIIRNIFNITFIFILLYTAIRTIIGSSGTDTKKMVANVVIAALLINFSLFITKIVIDAGNILAINFYNLATTNGSISTVIADVLGLGSIFATTGVDCTFCTQFFIVTQIQMFTMLIAIVVLGYIMVLMLVRTVVLIFLMVLSPVGFMGDVLPKVSEYSKMWREELYGQVFIAPIFLLFFYLIVQIGQSLNPGTLAVVNSVATNGANQAAVTANNAAVAASNASFTIYFKYMLIIVLLFTAVKITKKMSGAIGAAVEKFGVAAAGIAVGAATGGAAFAGKQLIGRGVAANLAKSEKLSTLASDKNKNFVTKFAARQIMQGAKKTSDATFDVRNTSTFKSAASMIGDHTGLKIDYDKGISIKKGGYEGMVKDRVKEEEEFIKNFEKVQFSNQTLNAKRGDINIKINSTTNELTTKRGTLNNPNANLTEDQKRELRSDISKLENKLDNWKGMTITQANTPGATPEMIKESEKKLKTEMQRELKEKYADVAEEGIINTVLGANKAAAGAIRKAAKSKSADDDLLAAIRGANQATPPPTPPPPPVPPPPAQNCWVAEVLYGIDDQKTHAARLWATTNNNWFTKLYREHGKVWARWLSAHTWAQPIVKPIWDIMAIKGQTLAVKARTGNFSMNSEYNYLLERVK